MPTEKVTEPAAVHVCDFVDPAPYGHDRCSGCGAVTDDSRSGPSMGRQYGEQWDPAVMSIEEWQRQRRKDRQKAKEQARAEPAPAPVKCPTPHKKAHRSKKAALNHAVSRSYVRSGRFSRVYECRCGKWHVTHWTQEEFDTRLGSDHRLALSPTSV